VRLVELVRIFLRRVALRRIRNDIVLLSCFIGRRKPALAEKADPVGIDGRAA